MFRWGGEEFVVLAPELGDSSSLHRFAERVRALIAAEPFTPTALAITASVGGSLLTDTYLPGEVLELAARLTRQAKVTRDTVCVREAPRRLEAEPAT